MLTEEIRNQIDANLEHLLVRSIANPLEVIEQITYCCSAASTPAAQRGIEGRAARHAGRRRIFPAGNDGQPTP